MIVVDNATAEQQNKLTEYLKINFGYWHWFSDLWFVVDATGNWTVVTLRDKISEILPNAHTMVMQAFGDPTAWAGFGKSEMATWMHETWEKN
ncbi:MAG: hypothetical protein WA666_03690 [Nitrospirota bacterium]